MTWNAFSLAMILAFATEDRNFMICANDCIVTDETRQKAEVILILKSQTLWTRNGGWFDIHFHAYSSKGFMFPPGYHPRLRNLVVKKPLTRLKDSTLNFRPKNIIVRVKAPSFMTSQKTTRITKIFIVFPLLKTPTLNCNVSRPNPVLRVVLLEKKTGFFLPDKQIPTRYYSFRQSTETLRHEVMHKNAFSNLFSTCLSFTWFPLSWLYRGYQIGLKNGRRGWLSTKVVTKPYSNLYSI